MEFSEVQKRVVKARVGAETTQSSRDGVDVEVFPPGREEVHPGTVGLKGGHPRFRNELLGLKDVFIDRLEDRELFLVLTSISFSLFGFILGIWADGWEKLTIVPTLVIMPLTFLGGTFYSISMLPPAWQTVSLFNPVVYLISGFRWSFYENADVAVTLSLGMVVLFLAACVIAVWWIFKSGYKLRN